MRNLNEIDSGNLERIANVALLSDENKRVALVNFPKGHGLKPHTAPVDVMVIGVCGEAEVMLNDQLHHMKPNDFIVFPAEQKHSIEALSAFKMLIIK